MQVKVRVVSIYATRATGVGINQLAWIDSALAEKLEANGYVEIVAKPVDVVDNAPKAVFTPAHTTMIGGPDKPGSPFRKASKF